MTDLTQALVSLRPGAEWTLHDNDYDRLIWLDNTQTKPSKDELLSEAERLQVDYQNKEYQRKRAAEYPDFRDYLDGVVKGDQQQIQAYIDACQAVKAKYPKSGAE